MTRRDLNPSDASSRVIIQLERLNDLVYARPEDDASITPGLKYRRAEQHKQSKSQNQDMSRAIGSIERLLKDHESHYGQDATPVIDIADVATDIDQTLDSIQQLDLEQDVNEFVETIREDLEPVLNDYRHR